MRGIGLRLQGPPPGLNLEQGHAIVVLLMIPGNTVSLPGIVRNLQSHNTFLRIAIEFTAEAHEKVHVVRYIMHRRSQIFAEVNALYQNDQKA
jgi:hypothetical protein